VILLRWLTIPDEHFTEKWRTALLKISYLLHQPNVESALLTGTLPPSYRFSLCERLRIQHLYLHPPVSAVRTTLHFGCKVVKRGESLKEAVKHMMEAVSKFKEGEQGIIFRENKLEVNKLAAMLRKEAKGAFQVSVSQHSKSSSFHYSLSHCHCNSAITPLRTRKIR